MIYISLSHHYYIQRGNVREFCRNVLMNDANVKLNLMYCAITMLASLCGSHWPFHFAHFDVTVSPGLASRCSSFAFSNFMFLGLSHFSEVLDLNELRIAEFVIWYCFRTLQSSRKYWNWWNPSMTTIYVMLKKNLIKPHILFWEYFFLQYVWFVQYTFSVCLIHL